jgi:hypothetical protein
MRFVSAFALIGLLALATGCNQSDAPSGGKASGKTDDVTAAREAAGTANGRCPVKIDELVEKDAPTRTYKDPVTGKELKIGFCCDRCPKIFDKEPAKYVDLMRADPAKFGYVTR